MHSQHTGLMKNVDSAITGTSASDGKYARDGRIAKNRFHTWHTILYPWHGIAMVRTKQTVVAATKVLRGKKLLKQKVHEANDDT